MSDPVTVLVWRCAKNDPPEHERYVWTDVGESCFWGGKWSDTDGGPPTVWCDPTPPAADALTTDDVEVLTAMPGASTHTPGGHVMVAFTHHSMVAWHRAAARLRRAIEETTRE